MNDNGDDSGMIKVAAQDVMLVPACALQMPAAAVIRRLRNVDVIASFPGVMRVFQASFPEEEPWLVPPNCPSCVQQAGCKKVHNEGLFHHPRHQRRHRRRRSAPTLPSASVRALYRAVQQTRLAPLSFRHLPAVALCLVRVGPQDVHRAAGGACGRSRVHHLRRIP